MADPKTAEVTQQRAAPRYRIKSQRNNDLDNFFSDTNPKRQRGLYLAYAWVGVVILVASSLSCWHRSSQAFIISQ